MKKGLSALCLVSFLAIGAAHAQASMADPASAADQARSSATRDRGEEARERLLIAASSMDYPVTPSDLYTLTYRRSTGDVLVQTVQVAGDYSVDLGLFGKIDGRGLTFIEVKSRVESLVAESYARSYPSLTIEAVGVFRVSLGGAVARPRFLNAWGLSRVGELFDAAGEKGASRRSIELKSIDGEDRRCDLLMAMRTGDAFQDPLVRSGDAMILSSATTAIALSGEVRHPDGYELLPGEGLRDLVERFGGGLTDMADVSRIRIDRMTAKGPAAQYVELGKAYDQPTMLEGCIAVSIPSRMDNRPFVWFEGAVAGANSAGDATARSEAGLASSGSRGEAVAVPGDNNRVPVQIYAGEMLSDALKDMKNSFLPSADLSSASLYRIGVDGPTAVNLQPLLAMTNPDADFRLAPYDRIFVPTLKSTITVYGAVFSGGSFTYQPNSPSSYYIGLAGGVDPEKNGNGSYWVFDQGGKKKKAADPLMPNDRIYVPLNNFTYNFVRYTPLISGLVTMVVVVVPFVKDYLMK